jgi:hypothetical protein
LGRLQFRIFLTDADTFQSRWRLLCVISIGTQIPIAVLPPTVALAVTGVLATIRDQKSKSIARVNAGQAQIDVQARRGVRPK